MDAFGGEILDAIKRNHSVFYPTRMGDEVAIRCPYCGDSQKSPNKAHLYVELDIPYRFKCHRCETSGLVRETFLKDASLYENSLIISLGRIRRELKRANSVKNFTNPKDSKIFIPQAKGTELEYKKLNYINERIGCNITMDEIEKYRLVLNMKELYKQNNIKLQHFKTQYDQDRYIQLINALQNNAVGFLLNNRKQILFRAIHKDVFFRYYMFTLDPFIKEDIEKGYYSIGNKTDLMSEKFTVNLTEGVFDILGVYFNVRDQNNEELFIGSFGKGYVSVINNLARKGLIDCEYNFYSDQDVSLGFFKKLKERCIVMKDSKINVFNNAMFQVNKEFKDFGNRKENIKVVRAVV